MPLKLLTSRSARAELIPSKHSKARRNGRRVFMVERLAQFATKSQRLAGSGCD